MVSLTDAAQMGAGPRGSRAGRPSAIAPQRMVVGPRITGCAADRVSVYCSLGVGAGLGLRTRSRPREARCSMHITREIERSLGLREPENKKERREAVGAD